MSMTLQNTYTDEPVIGYAGTLDGGPVKVDSFKNADSVSIPFGSPLAFKPSGATTDLDATIPANSSDVVAGFLFRSDSYSRAWTDENGTHGELDSTGVVAGAIMNGVRRGRILVPCHTGCKPGDRLFIAFSANVTYSAKGQLGNAAEASHTIDCSNQGQWMSTATADGLAWLEFDFINK